MAYTDSMEYLVSTLDRSNVTMLFVKHGDNKPEAKKGIDAFEDMDD